MTRILKYWDFDRDERLDCRRCSWSGRAAEGGQEVFRELMEINCPQCDGRLLLVNFPTDSQTEQSARDGVPGAAAEALHAARSRARESEALTDPAVLPELDVHDLGSAGTREPSLAEHRSVRAQPLDDGRAEDAEAPHAVTSEFVRDQPRYDLETIMRASAYAAEVHRDDVRKSTTIPYLSHLWSVAALVMEHGGDEEQVAAGLLHDTAEDHGGVARIADIEQQFGPEVARLVSALSDSLVDTDLGERKAPWRERKEQYLSHLAQADERVALVSACDKLHNARCIEADLREVGGRLWSRFSVSDPAAHVWYYQSLLAGLHPKVPRPLGDALSRTVAAISALASNPAQRVTLRGDAERASARSIKEHGRSDYRDIALAPSGELVVSGQSIEMDQEYEFERRLSATDVRGLCELLSAKSPHELLDSIEARFESSAEFERFLVENGLAGDFWNRFGD